MKTLKFDHASAQMIAEGQKDSTWRLFDDKDLSVDDEIRIIDKVDPKDQLTWKIIGHAKVIEVVEKKLGDISQQDMNGHEAFTSNEAMLKNFQKFYGQRVSFETPVKIVIFTFAPTNSDIPSVAMLLDEAKLYTDGGSRGNPGDSACAYVICKMDDSVVEKSGFYLGMATNNQAEYSGFKSGLERARNLGIDKIHLFSDSQLVVNQMKGVYKVRNQELAPLHKDVNELANSFEEITISYIPRELNKEADSEVNRILDQQERSKREH